MRRLCAAAVRRTVRQAVVVPVVIGLFAALAAEARAIEMFTFFGDGSRIGLPSLEVPIEAYPGIPLRSDRIRARNRALARQRGMPMQPGQLQPARGITIRTMPTAETVPLPAPVAPEPAD